MATLGLAEGQQPVILAEGVDFPAGDPGGRNNLLDQIGSERPTCEELTQAILSGELGEGGATYEATDAGTILYFPHSSGGHVLVIGASATPWALESDAALSGLLRRSLACFAYDEGCNQEIFLPAVLKSSQ